MSHWQRMERDLHVQRQQILHSGSVSVLGTTTQVFDAEILERYEGETQIWLNEPLRCATLVRIEYSDTLLLGEVVCCEKEQAGWLVGIRIEHALLGLKALARARGER